MLSGLHRLPGVREVGLALAIYALALAGLGWSGDWLGLRSLDTALLDLNFRLRGPLPIKSPVTVVLVDDASLAALGRWPLSRRLYAEALTRLSRAGARVVAFDLLFAEPEAPIPADLRNAAAQAAGLVGDPDLAGKLETLASDDADAALEAALGDSGRAILPMGLLFQGPEQPANAATSDAGYAAFAPSPVPPVTVLSPRSVLPPIPALAAASAGVGHVAIAFDRDGMPRYEYAALPFDGDYLPAMSVRIAAAALGAPWSKVALAPGSGVQLGDRFVPTDAAMRLLVNYRGPRGTVPTLSFADLLNGRVALDSLRDRILLIGASFTGNSDANGAPFGRAPLPGVERLGQIVDQLLQGDFITEFPQPASLIAEALIALLAVLFAISATRLTLRNVVTLAAAALAATLSGLHAAFQGGLWLPAAAPLTALVAAMLSVLMFRYWVVDRAGRQVRAAFRQYLSPDLLDMLAAHPERLTLGGETRAMTIMFCDLRGFTTISERFKTDPQGLTRLINRFLTPMTAAIIATHGTIDKYIGDCVMAFWNAPLDDPDHADDACRASLGMMAALADLNQQLAREPGPPMPHLAIGIGVNSGACVVGNMGSDQRFDYTVLGDAVNLSSRLEGQSKTYGVETVLGEETVALLRQNWALLELDLIAVKGKREAVRIYTLLGDDRVASDPDHQRLVSAHTQMLAAYRRQDWPAALAALTQAQGLSPRLSGLYALYLSRINHYIDHPPEPDWEGVFIATVK